MHGYEYNVDDVGDAVDNNDNDNEGRVLAEWFRHCSSDGEVAGSTPVGCPCVDVVFQE